MNSPIANGNDYNLYCLLKSPKPAARLPSTDASWRDLPERYGPWGTVASRFYRWRKAGLWARLFAAVQQRADAAEQLDWAIHDGDGTRIRAHQHAAGAPSG